MATSPNFNWPEPDNTDLVKNGALAIRTAVDAIDSSMADLKGGTTGQVLSKTSNTDMDFTWVAQDDSNAIQNAIVDAKGDIITATAADTPARIAVGANGTVLTADSSEATGLKWATPASGMTNPMTTTGDTIYSSSGSTPARLPIGSTGQVLTVSGGVPTWATPSAGGGGKVLQVVQTTYSTSTTVASTSYTDTGLTLSITPTASTSKVLVIVNQSSTYYRNAQDMGYGIRLVRGATNLFSSGIASAGYTNITGGSGVEVNTMYPLTYLDSPATTSSTTYKVQGAAYTTANGGAAGFQPGNTVSIITLMEIGA